MTATTAQPLWFGPPDAPLSGWYHPAKQSVSNGPAVILCPPFGYEAVCTHRTFRALAVRLADAGLPTLRFDYDGTGDSAGDDRAPARLLAWCNSIGAAADELKARAGVTKISLVGLRLGATLATLAAASRDDVAALVLWAPCPVGRLFVRELKMLRATADSELTIPSPPPPLGRNADDDEAAGFLLSASTLQSLAKIDLYSLPTAPAPRILLLERDDLPGDARLGNHLQSLGAGVSFAPAMGYAAMMQDPHKSVVPEEILDTIRNWLQTLGADIAARVAPTKMDAARIALVPVSGEGEGLLVREECVTIDLGGRDLQGIVTSPVTAPDASPRRGVVLFNAGAIRRIGPNRLHVSLARKWAGMGITSLRVDLGGLGDSDATTDGQSPIYSLSAVPDARAAINFLCTHGGFSRVTIAGLCAGAYVAFHAALADASVARSLLINPQTFFWKEGSSVDVVRRRSFQAAQHYSRSVLRKDSWLKLLRGDVDVNRALDLLGDRVANKLRDKLQPVREALGLQAENQVISAFRATVGSGIDTVLILCRDDPGLDYLQSHLGEGLIRLPKASTIRVEIVDGPDHTFTPLWSHQLLANLLTRHVLRPL